ncbi:MAG: GNAT family N-acetyltransferase [Firmicutes bacterium]|nr:GNAT family N-acetyltransferase [Bacillota bacterium]
MILKAQIEDLEEIASLARIITKNIHDLGIDQWSDSYPLYEHFEKDMNASGLYVFKSSGKLISSISILPENDPFYTELTWLKEKSLVVHRLMVHPDYMKQHIGSLMMDFARLKAINEGYESIKVDTHPDNIRMQKLILSCGYTRIGYMTRMNRIGYELVL